MFKSGLGVLNGCLTLCLWWACVGCGRGAGKDLRRGYIVPNFAGQFFSTVEDVTKIRFPFNFGGEWGTEADAVCELKLSAAACVGAVCSYVARVSPIAPNATGIVPIPASLLFCL